MRIINRKKIIVITLLILLIFCISIGLILSINFRFKEQEFNTYKLTEESNLFAIYFENTDGTYTEQKSNSFPTEGYTFNSTKSVCFNEDGNIIANVLSFENNKLKLKTTQASYCYLYFDILE